MRLSDWLTHNSLSEAEFARRIGTTRVAVGRYIAGTRVPRRDVMTKIEAETAQQVTANDFYAGPAETVAPAEGVQA